MGKNNKLRKGRCSNKLVSSTAPSVLTIASAKRNGGSQVVSRWQYLYKWDTAQIAKGTHRKQQRSSLQWWDVVSQNIVDLVAKKSIVGR